MVGEFDSVKRGGLGAYGFEYFDIGYEAGANGCENLKGWKETIRTTGTATAKFKTSH